MRYALDIGGAAAIFVQLVIFFRWLVHREGTNRINRIFVSDMATNHLPHIYDALHSLCEKDGIKLAEPPRIRWIDLNDDKQ